MWPCGVLTMVSGQVRPLLFLHLIQDGSTYQLILFSFIMWFQDCKDNSQEILIFMEVILRVHYATGCMRVLTMSMYGLFPRKCGDGWSFTTVAMFYWLTRLKQAGTTSQIEDRTQKQTQEWESLTQSTFTTTIFTLMHTKSRELKEELLLLTQATSCLEVSSAMNQDGDHPTTIEKQIWLPYPSLTQTSIHSIYLNKCYCIYTHFAYLSFHSFLSFEFNIQHQLIFISFFQDIASKSLSFLTLFISF